MSCAEIDPGNWIASIAGSGEKTGLARYRRAIPRDQSLFDRHPRKWRSEHGCALVGSARSWMIRRAGPTWWLCGDRPFPHRAKARGSNGIARGQRGVDLPLFRAEFCGTIRAIEETGHGSVPQRRVQAGTVSNWSPERTDIASGCAGFGGGRLPRTPKSLRRMSSLRV